MSLEFEWNAPKADANLKKHGVAFDEALSVFADPLARIFDDPDHSEKRATRDHYWLLDEGAAAGRRLYRTVRTGQTDSRAARDKIRTKTP